MSGAVQCVVACISVGSNSGSITALTAATTTGMWSGRQPAITAAMATFSTVAMPARTLSSEHHVRIKPEASTILRRAPRLELQRVTVNCTRDSGFLERRFLVTCRENISHYLPRVRSGFARPLSQQHHIFSTGAGYRVVTERAVRRTCRVIRRQNFLETKTPQ